jgi:hypothetical protein
MFNTEVVVWKLVDSVYCGIAADFQSGTIRAWPDRRVENLLYCGIPLLTNILRAVRLSADSYV